MTFPVYILLLLCSLAISFKERRSLSNSYKQLAQMLFVIFISEVIGRILKETIGTSIPPYHFLQPTQAIYFGLIFYHLLRVNQLGKWLLVLITVTIVITCILLSIFYQSIYAFPSIGLVLLSLFVVVNCLILLVQMLNKPSMEPLWKQANFWFAIGNLQFHTITFFIFGLYKALLENNVEEPTWFYTLIWICNLILYCFDGLAIHFDARSNRAKGLVNSYST